MQPLFFKIRFKYVQHVLCIEFILNRFDGRELKHFFTMQQQQDQEEKKKKHTTNQIKNKIEFDRYVLNIDGAKIRLFNMNFNNVLNHSCSISFDFFLIFFHFILILYKSIRFYVEITNLDTHTTNNNIKHKFRFFNGYNTTMSILHLFSSMIFQYFFKFYFLDLEPVLNFQFQLPILFFSIKCRKANKSKICRCLRLQYKRKSFYSISE